MIAMSTDDAKPDLTVKQLLERGPDTALEEIVDAVTAAELEKWFGLPSFQQVDEGARAPATEDPDIAAVRERRQRAIAAVDPALLEAHRRRMEAPEALIRFKPAIDLRVDPGVALLDVGMIENRLRVAEPREVERPEDIEDQLREDNTPQALLRDLHRPELEFEKTFEIVDAAAEQKIDVVAAVQEAMSTSWKLPPLGDTPAVELRALLAELRAERDAPWPLIPTRTNLPNRRVRE